MTESDKKRRVRSPESIAAEVRTRDMVGPFLKSKGYWVDGETRVKSFHSWKQIVRCRNSRNDALVVKVRLVWYSPLGEDEKWAAVQFGTRDPRARVSETPEQIVERTVRTDTMTGVSHYLFVERQDDDIITALLVPIGEAEHIWRKQRDFYDDLLESRRTTGKRNPAENGDSPSISVRDTRNAYMQGAAEIVYDWPSVIDLLVDTQQSHSDNDTFDDCPIPPDDGRDQGVARETRRSDFPRNAKVRRKVRERANGSCENPACDERREWQSFLDVHHTMGIEKSDRIWTCVALCPNCHRAAHHSPQRDELNRLLESIAQAFKDPFKTT